MITVIATSAAIFLAGPAFACIIVAGIKGKEGKYEALLGGAALLATMVASFIAGYCVK